MFWLSIYLSTYLSIYLCTYLPIYLSTYLPYLPIYLFSSTISFLFPAFPIPSSLFFGRLLEEVDTWGFPVL